MLNGMGRTLEKQLPESDRRRPPSSLPAPTLRQAGVREDGENHGASPRGFPEPRTLRPE